MFKNGFKEEVPRKNNGVTINTLNVHRKITDIAELDILRGEIEGKLAEVIDKIGELSFEQLNSEEGKKLQKEREHFERILREIEDKRGDLA